jgi:stress response protein YsnF
MEIEEDKEEGKDSSNSNNINNKTIDKKQEEVQVQPQQQQIVPVLEEDYSISKETTVKEAKIEKRLVTKTKTIKIPIVYEELYINGKKLKSVEEPRILSALKDKISSIAASSSVNADTSVEQSVKKKNKIENRGELVSLLSSSSLPPAPSSSSAAITTAADEEKEKHEKGDNSKAQIEIEIEVEKEKEKEKVIPLYEEQFEIIKKMVKVAEIVITKRRVTEKKKVDIDIRGEEVKIKYPDGRSEKLS